MPIEIRNDFGFSESFSRHSLEFMKEGNESDGEGKSWMSVSLANEIILLFGLIAVGYAANKTGVLDEMSNSRFSSFILKVTLPSTIVNSVIGQRDINRAEVLLVMAVAVGVFVFLPLLSLLITSAFHWEKTYQLMLNYSNLGFMGFPIINSLYGEENLLYAAVFMMIFNFHVFTVGVMTLQGGKKDNLESGADGQAAKIFLNPGILSSVLAFFIVMFPVSVPAFISSSVGNIVGGLGAVTTPLALVVIGSQLAQVNLLKCLSRWELYLMSVFKLVVYPSLVYLILTVVVGPGMITNIATILVGLPVAGNVTMLCSEYGGDVSLAAQGTCVAILLSLATIPVMLSVLIHA